MLTPHATYSYGWFAQAAEQISQVLRAAAGFRAGSSVALVGKNPAAFIAGLYGILAAGGVVVPLPPEVERRRLNTLFEVGQIDFVLSAEGLSATVDQELGTPHAVVTLGSPSPGPDLDDPAQARGIRGSMIGQRSFPLRVADIMALCREELPAYQVPAIVEIVDEVPLNAALKIDRLALERQATERLALPEPSHADGGNSSSADRGAFLANRIDVSPLSRQAG